MVEVHGRNQPRTGAARDGREQFGHQLAFGNDRNLDPEQRTIRAYRFAHLPDLARLRHQYAPPTVGTCMRRTRQRSHAYDLATGLRRGSRAGGRSLVTGFAPLNAIICNKAR